MLKRVLVLFLLTVLVPLFPGSPAWADGIIIPKPPPHLPKVWPELTIKYHRVQVAITDQVATTRVDQVFLNEADFPVEGTYVFPLPEEAAISSFDMWVDGEPLGGRLLDRDEARRIYEEIVRRRKDPALLEYVGRDAFQAHIFPIPPHGERRVQIEYQEVLLKDQGLVRYVYPLNTEKFSARPLEEVSVSVELESEAPLKAIYSPSHPVAVDRESEHRARIGYEARHVKPDTDFALYYSLAQEEVGVSLLSYKPPRQEGFFLLLVAPQVEVDAGDVIARDVICVLDTSGSMQGEKLDQAKDALRFVLDHLNREDRFNIVAFSTGVRAYASYPRPVSEVQEAGRFVDRLEAVGGTDINRALLEALTRGDAERPTILIFLTDGLPTEGVTEVGMILTNVAEAAADSVRIFPFGVGDDVNTLLLDRLAEAHRGATGYVRPGQAIDEEVSAFYAKVSRPIMADLRLDFGPIVVEDTYPYPLPDLFAGAQLVIVGRYRQGGAAEVALSGMVNDRQHRLSYEGLHFRREGGEPFIARLWATRKIGHLLSEIRLHGESQELVDEVVALSIRYGIITPYTSFLVEEPEAALTRRGREEIVRQEVGRLASTPAAVSGGKAVDRAQVQGALKVAEVPPEVRQAEVRIVGDRAFVLRDGVWTDTAYDPSEMKPLRLGFATDAYFRLIAHHPEWGRYFALGQNVIVVLEGQAYEVIPGEDASQASTASPAPPQPVEPAPGPVVSVRPKPSSLWESLLWFADRWLVALLGR